MSSGSPGLLNRKGKEEVGGRWDRTARPAAGVDLSSGQDLLSPLGGEEGVAQDGSGRARAAALTPAWGAEGLPPGGALTVMAAPRGGESRRQEDGRGSEAGLRGAGIPPPPPLSAARRRSSGPSLPRSCPGPFHPPIKLFFSNFLGGPGQANERRGSRDKQRRGRRMANGSASWAQGRGLRRRDGRAKAGGAGGWGREEGRGSRVSDAGALGGSNNPACR